MENHFYMPFKRNFLAHASIYKGCIFLCILFSLSCKNSKEENTKQAMFTIEKTFYGTTKDDKKVFQYVIQNKLGMRISVITYGGIITSWTAKDRNEEYKDIVLGHDTLEEYEVNTPYFGAIIGRYGNRIANGTFELNGTTYKLATNNNTHHLHGGIKGFDKVVWEAKEILTDTTAALELRYLSKDMEEGYPGNLQVKVVYTLNMQEELKVDYEATTDKATLINLTQHSYFNLTGNFDENILEHELEINADSFLPVDATLIPTGEIRKVEGSPFDFRSAKKIGHAIDEASPQLKNGLGYDHCWVLNETEQKLRFVASAYEAKSGRLLEVYSSEPGVQFYSGNFLDGTLAGKNNSFYKHRSGFCLETQHFPNSPNETSFPSTELQPGEIYKSQTVFKLRVK